MRLHRLTFMLLLIIFYCFFLFYYRGAETQPASTTKAFSLLHRTPLPPPQPPSNTFLKTHTHTSVSLSRNELLYFFFIVTGLHSSFSGVGVQILVLHFLFAFILFPLTGRSSFFFFLERRQLQRSVKDLLLCRLRLFLLFFCYFLFSHKYVLRSDSDKQARTLRPIINKEKNENDLSMSFPLVIQYSSHYFLFCFLLCFTAVHPSIQFFLILSSPFFSW